MGWSRTRFIDETLAMARGPVGSWPNPGPLPRRHGPIALGWGSTGSWSQGAVSSRRIRRIEAGPGDRDQAALTLQ